MLTMLSPRNSDELGYLRSQITTRGWGGGGGGKQMGEGGKDEWRDLHMRHPG